MVTLAFKKVLKILFQAYVFLLDVLSKILIFLGNRSRFEIFLIFLVVIYFAGHSGTGSQIQKPKTESRDVTKSSPTLDKKNMELTFDLLKIKSIKESMNNPSSFELVEAIKTDDGTLCVTYRGTNAFNAVMTERMAILSNAQVGNWNRACAGKSGVSMTHLRHFL